MRNEKKPDLRVGLRKTLRLESTIVEICSYERLNSQFRRIDRQRKVVFYFYSIKVRLKSLRRLLQI